MISQERRCRIHGLYALGQIRIEQLQEKTLIPLQTLRQLYDFNFWARDRQLQVCAQLTADQLLRPMGSSFSSIRDTLAHLLSTELYWLHRCRGCTAQDVLDAFGVKTREERFTKWPGQFQSVADLYVSWKPIETGYREFLSDLTERQLGDVRMYRTMTGEEERYTLWAMLLTLVDHQTYHRGQVATLLRQLGFVPPNLDPLGKYFF